MEHQLVFGVVMVDLDTSTTTGLAGKMTCGTERVLTTGHISLGRSKNSTMAVGKRTEQLLDPIKASMTQSPMLEKQLLLCLSEILVGFISDGSIMSWSVNAAELGTRRVAMLALCAMGGLFILEYGKTTDWEPEGDVMVRKS
jgi:hypothetical protein